MRSNTAPMGWPACSRTISLLGALLSCHCSEDTGSSIQSNPAVNAGNTAAGGGAGGTVTATAGTPAVSTPVGTAGTQGNAAVGGMAGSSRAGRGGMTPSAAGSAGMSMMMPRAGMGASGAPATTAGTGAGTGVVPPAGPATPSTGCGKTDVPPSGSTMIDVDGTQRQFVVKVPAAYDANTPHRLVFAWHGLGGTSMQIASNFYGLASRSADSAIFIAGQGLKGTGQQADYASWTNTGDRDIKFTRKMLEWAKTSYCIDEKRVFSIGMSNGGMMSNVVGCEMGDAIRAMAAMSGGGPTGYAMAPCVGQTAVWISHGNKDDNVPFSYGQKSRDYWVKTNHCMTATAPVAPANCLEYQGCDAGYPVQFCEFDGGHMVPSFAGEAAWNFFSKF